MQSRKVGFPNAIFCPRFLSPVENPEHHMILGCRQKHPSTLAEFRMQLSEHIDVNGRH